MAVVLGLAEITAGDLPVVGGKGANLGEMMRVGLPVPPGFCVTTAAFRQFVAQAPDAPHYFDALAALDPADVAGACELGQAFRARLRAIPVPGEVARAAVEAWQALSADAAYAVRSSATAEDLPTASFAGQQDTFLNVQGEDALLDAIHRCWVSLFTDRAILYRLQSGFGQQQVQLAVVVQRMVRSAVSGTLFTADPVTGHRQHTVIDASFGLGEALVAGLVTPDRYRVDKRTGAILDRQIADKQVAIWPLAGGGTERRPLTGPERGAQALPDAHIGALAQLAARIEAHYGQPQDIEWAVEDGLIYIVQSRPITALFPLPEPVTRGGERLYISLSHAQVMTDPISPAGLSMWRVILPMGRAQRFRGEHPYVLHAGGRLYVDISPLLVTRIGRRVVPYLMQAADPLTGLALAGAVERDDFNANVVSIQDRARPHRVARWLLPPAASALWRLWFAPPDRARGAVDARVRGAVEWARRRLPASGPEGRLAAAYEVAQEVFARHALRLVPFIMVAAMSKVLLERLLGSAARAADLAAIQRGMTGNVTVQMDLQVGDLADVARQSPAAAAAFEADDPRVVLSRLNESAGSAAFLQAFDAFLETYGMRCSGEIDIARARWRDDPAPLLQMIRGGLQKTEPGLHRAHFEALALEADAAAERLVASVREQPLGWMAAPIVRRWITVFRTYMPLREHPKFMLVQVFQMVRDVVREAGDHLHAAGRIAQPEDIWYLFIPEMLDALREPSRELQPRIAARQAAYRQYRRLTPPRVMTAHGEVLTGQHTRDDLPAGALAGSAVSAGIVEGRARVVLDPAHEMLTPGEILVAPFTDPAWTPLFINAAGLVMEVGGMLTHGSVVAREYGIPAVVSVVGATTAIQTGQRIRVNGDQGFVEILDQP